MSKSWSAAGILKKKHLKRESSCSLQWTVVWTHLYDYSLGPMALSWSQVEALTCAMCKAFGSSLVIAKPLASWKSEAEEPWRLKQLLKVSIQVWSSPVEWVTEFHTQVVPPSLTRHVVRMPRSLASLQHSPFPMFFTLKPSDWPSRVSCRQR